MAVSHVQQQGAAGRTDAPAFTSDDVRELCAAVQAGNLESVRALQASGTPISAADDNGRTALMAAAEAGHVELLATLVDEGCALDATTYLGWNALFYAAQGGHAEAVRDLIKRGVKVDTKDVASVSPLMIAAARGHADALGALLDAGADATARDVAGRDALMHCVGATADVAVIERLAQAAGAVALEGRDVAGRSPLILAVLANAPRGVAALMKLGADASICDDPVPDLVVRPPAPPTAAARAADDAIADAHQGVEETPGRGRSALDYAIERKYKHIQRYLEAWDPAEAAEGRYPDVDDQVYVQQRMRAKAEAEARGETAAAGADEGGEEGRRGAGVKDAGNIFEELEDEDDGAGAPGGDAQDEAALGETGDALAAVALDDEKVEASLEDLD
mmetsp:Transcript_17116/g.46321  ORF Transcript_17116/g.46321 Transcript_17116/m.46321 type:complete len:392 (+) Transcript_17116:774-1949(+)